MTFRIGRYYRGNRDIKPQQWGTPADVQSSIFANAEREGMPAPSVAFPCWERAGILPRDYASGLSCTNEQGSPTLEATGLKLDNNGHGTTNDVISIDNFIPNVPVDQTYIFRLNRYLDPNDGGICTNLNRYDFYYHFSSKTFFIVLGKDDGWRHEGYFGSWELNTSYNLGWTASASKNEVHGIQDSTITSIPKFSTTGWAGRPAGTITQKMYLGRRTSWTIYFGADAIYESIFGFPAVLPDSQIAYLSDNPYFLLHPRPSVFYSVPSGAITLRQFGFRFRNDDGNESAATWNAAENTNVSLAPGSKIRIRMGIVKE